MYLHYLLSFQSCFKIFLQIQHNKKCDSIQCTEVYFEFYIVTFVSFCDIIFYF
jgi:hypothetical protein